jgi:Na+/proline symporter
MVLSVISGIQIYYCIVVIGFVSTLYTYLGGIEAVIWSDVMQLCIMVGGLLFAIGVALFRVDDPMAAFSFAVESGKTKVFDTGLNFSTLTVWVFLLSLPGQANEEVSGQTIVQRFVSAKDQNHAATSAWINGFGGPVLITTFFFIGTAMWMFYEAHPEELNPLMRQPDEILAWFVVEQLPVGISGLMVGAIFAATMSSVDSSLSSTTTVIINDGYRRFKRGTTDASALRAAHQITFFLGVTGTVSALILAAMEVRSLLDFMLELLALMGGGLAGIFYLGMFTVRAGTVSVIAGFFASVGVLAYFKYFTEFSFFLFGTAGVLACVLVGYAVSVVFPAAKRDLTGLTVHTLAR